LKKIFAVGALLSAFAGRALATAPTLNFADATNVAGQAAGGARDTFYAVLPIALVVGLTIMGWRFVRRLSR